MEPILIKPAFSPASPKMPAFNLDNINMLKMLPRVPKIVVVADIETSGPNKQQNYMLALGASVFMPQTDVPVAEFFCGMFPPIPGCGFDPKTKVEFWDKHPEVLVDIGAARVPATVAMDTFVAFILALQADSIVFLSDFPQFDFGWLDFYLESYSSSATPSYLLRGVGPEVAINADDMTRQALRDASTKWVDTAAAAKVIGFEYYNNPSPHSANADARTIGINWLRMCAATGVKVL